MGTTARGFQPRTDAEEDMTGQVAYPATNYMKRLSADGNALSSNTRASFPSGSGTTFVTLRPNLTVNATQSPATDANKKISGWVMNPRGSLGFDSLAAAQRFIPAGQWQFRTRWTSAVSQVNPDTTVYIDCYKRHVDGTFTHLFQALDTVAIGGQTGAQLDITSTQPQITLAEDETLHFSVTVRAPTVAITGQEIIMQVNNDTVALGTLQSIWNFPAPGVRTLFPRSESESAPYISDTLSRIVVFPRSTPDTALATDSLVRALIAARETGDTASSVDSLTRFASFPRATSDAASASDVLTRLMVSPRAVTDSAPASDVLQRIINAARALTESAPASDTLSRAVTTTRGTSDTVLASDVVTRQVITVRALSDSAPADDELDRGTIQFRRLTADLTGGSDVVSRVLTNVRVTRDNIGPDAVDIVTQPTREIAGVVRNATGVPVEGAVVKLFRQSDDRAVRETISSADGSYSFDRDLFDTETYYVVSYLAGVPQTQGITERDLVPS